MLGTLDVAFRGLGDLGPLESPYTSHAAGDDGVPQVVVEIEVDPHAGIDRGRSPVEWACTHERMLRVSTAHWDMDVPLRGRCVVRVRLKVWWADAFDQMVRCLVQILAPVLGGAIVLHASSVVRDGMAFVFAAHADTGKTTIARLSSGMGLTILAEEMTFVGRAEDGRPMVCSLPVFERDSLRTTRPTCAPLARIYRIVQAGDTRIEDIPKERRLLELASVAAVAVRAPAVMDYAFSAVSRLVGSCPPKILNFTPSPALWQAVDQDLAQTT